MSWRPERSENRPSLEHHIGKGVSSLLMLQTLSSNVWSLMLPVLIGALMAA